MNLVKLDFRSKSDQKSIYNVGHTFCITSKTLPHFHCSQVNPHHAHSRQMRFEVGKRINLVKLDFPVESYKKQFLQCRSFI